MGLKDYRFKKRHVLYIITVFLIGYLLQLNISLKTYVTRPDKDRQSISADNSRFTYTVPLDGHSPWPKFRGNALQNGRSDVIPELSNLKPWSFKTGKGIFSSPVIDQAGTAYIGSADQYFYAIDEQGKLKWKLLTGEIIDSSALLDDGEMVYFGSGDAHVYAVDRDTGKIVWRFKAHTPREVTEQFDIKTYNLNWFEGNIAMLPDGSIIAPNDNYLIYRLDRHTGQGKTPYFINEMGWSLPAVNSQTENIFTGSNFMAVKNVFSFNINSGETEWTNGGFGTNAASVMLTSENPDGLAIIGGYDGIVRAFGQSNGFQVWKFGTRDHIYASPSQLKDGTIVQPSTDGTVYGIDPDSGSLKWAFDTKEPIRSSPAIDGNDNIYFGSGEGRLYCLNPDGTLRWAYQLIDDVRNDINGSPGLGRRGVYIAGENGTVFFMPYDYPLTAEGEKDSKSIQGPGEDLPFQGEFLYYTTGFGSLELSPPDEIEANQPLAFTLYVRENGDTVKTNIDRDSVKVNIEGGFKGKVDTAANAQFITIIPQETWAPPGGGTITITINGKFIRDPWRLGLKFFGGSSGGEFQQAFTVKVKPRSAEQTPFKVPVKAGDLSSTMEISRLAPANPSILPSYNQIGYDSLHYILGAVEENDHGIIVWGVGGKLLGDEKKTVIDPSLEVRFPMILNYDNGLVTLFNYDGILLDMNGSWDMPIDFFRFSGTVDPVSGRPTSYAAMNAIVECDRIEFYGKFLKLLGMSEIDTGRMFIYGGSNYSLFEGGVTTGPEVTGTVTFENSNDAVTVKISDGALKKQDHVFGILLISEETGRPVSVEYINKTDVQTDESDRVTEVTLSLENSSFKGRARVYYMVDTYPAAKGSIIVQ